MKYRCVRILIVLTLMFTWLGFRSAPAFAAGGCKNVTCEGLNPNTMGCPAIGAGSVKYLSDGGSGLSIVETRQSTSANCDAKWARTTNLSGGSRYAAASLRYGCSNYCYAQSVSSPGTITNGNGVYTPMHAYAATPTRSCGAVSTSGPISIPIGINASLCTGVN
jgi:hypothetical protein